MVCRFPVRNEFYTSIDSMPEIKPPSRKSVILVSDLVSRFFSDTPTPLQFASHSTPINAKSCCSIPQSGGNTMLFAFFPVTIPDIVQPYGWCLVFS